MLNILIYQEFRFFTKIVTGRKKLLDLNVLLNAAEKIVKVFVFT